MSEQKPTPDSGEQKTGVEDPENTTSVDEELISKAKYDALETKLFRLGKKLDGNKELVKELNTQLAEYKNSNNGNEDDATRAIRESAAAEIAKAMEERDAAIAKSQSAIVKAEVLSLAENYVIDKADFWNYTKDKYAAGENPDGTYSAEVKDSIQTLQESIEAYCAEKPHNARAQKKSGSGVPGQASTSKSGQVPQVKDLANMSGPEKQKALINNPELMKEAEKLF
jgi:hypothetical protein